MRIGTLAVALALGMTTLVAPRLDANPRVPAPASSVGSIRGVITDSRTGEAVAGATVVVTSPALKESQVTLTDEKGAYVIEGLPPGTYLVTVYYADAVVERPGVMVAAGKATPVFAKVSGQQTGEVIQIKSTAPVIDPTSTTQGITIDKNYLRNIPVPGRTFQSTLGAPAPRRDEGPNTESYARIDDNPFVHVSSAPLSTFSVDVDTASYANARRFLREGTLPPKDAVRIEELINYFHYDYPQPVGDAPFSITTEVGASPWHPQYKLVRIGLQAHEIAAANVPARNLVFLVDVSGSMEDENKLPLLIQALGLLVDNLRPQDRIAIVAYADGTGVVLPSTPGTKRLAIKQALGGLHAQGSTNGGAGIQLAYKEARDHFIGRGINRVILCTDGDFNVGTTSEGELTRLIETERQANVSLTVLGFGMGNLKDSTMEKLADRGNGNYAYIDSIDEARKVLVKEAGGTLVTVAKDVKLQLELNPATVAGYRLIGYEDRLLHDEDFNDDKKDAGDIGAGHSVTALYELVPAGIPVPGAKVDKLRYQAPAPSSRSTELMTVKVRYKPPTGDTSKLLVQPVPSATTPLDRTSTDFRWAAAVAGYGMLLRESPERGTISWPQIKALATGAIGKDPDGYRKELLDLVDRASKLKRP